MRNRRCSKVNYGGMQKSLTLCIVCCGRRLALVVENVNFLLSLMGINDGRIYSLALVSTFIIFGYWDGNN